MNKFKVVEIIAPNRVRVSPRWKFSKLSGDIIQIRGIDPSQGQQTIMARLNKLMLNEQEKLKFTAPEVVDQNNPDAAVISCSVYYADSNILYYFPEFIYK